LLLCTKSGNVGLCIYVYFTLDRVSGTRSTQIAYRQSAITNKLAPKPTPKANTNPTLTYTELKS